MARQLHVLAPTRYPWRFNSPRHSRHDISIRKFLPMNRFDYRLEGVTLFNPWPPKRFDLIHTYNRIPISSLPFVIGYESHLPRAYGLEHTVFYRLMARRLAHPKCRRIVAISRYAERHLRRQHEGQEWQDAITAKLEVRYPNIDIPDRDDAFSDSAQGPLRLIFIGNHFGRKGGCAVVRLAELALAEGLPLEIEIVSGIEVGIMSWVDPLRVEFFDDDRAKLLNLPNIRYSKHVPNADLLARINQAHFVLLPTFADTFGFSAIEAMAWHTPVITTTQGALPEFIRHRDNGILLPLNCDSYGDWVHMKRPDRNTPAYEALFRDENERLAQAMLSELRHVATNREAYLAMRRRARETAETLFCAKAASAYWDQLYDEAAA